MTRGFSRRTFSGGFFAGLAAWLASKARRAVAAPSAPPTPPASAAVPPHSGVITYVYDPLGKG